jgi:hypothetical protein
MDQQNTEYNQSTELKYKWSRKRWCGEQSGTPCSDYDEYQASYRGRERRLPIFTDGTMEVCVFPSDSAAIVERTLEGRQWKKISHWRDSRVTVYREISNKR